MVGHEANNYEGTCDLNCTRYAHLLGMDGASPTHTAWLTPVTPTCSLAYSPRARTCGWREMVYASTRVAS